MEKQFHGTQEEMEFYSFKLTIKEQMLASASEDLKEQYKSEVDQVKQEIRWIQQRINDEKSGLQNAQNNLDYEMNWDASVRSEQEFEASN